jgi:hypothetical protein
LPSIPRRSVGCDFLIGGYSMEKVGHYIIKSHPYKFGASIIYDAEYERYVIKLGGKEECVSIHVYNEEPYQCMLTGVSFKEHCSIDNILERGQGTEKMLKVSLKFTLSLFPHVNNVYFIDVSKIPCKRNYYLSLAVLSIAKYGTTWYQRKFNAIPENDSVLVALSNIDAKMQGPKDMHFDKFALKYICKNKDLRKNTMDGLRLLYNRTSSYREFITEAHTYSKDCLVFKDWLYFFISGLEPLNLQAEYFYISKDAINEWNNVLNVSRTEISSMQSIIKDVILNVPTQKGGGPPQLFDPDVLKTLKATLRNYRPTGRVD